MPDILPSYNELRQENEQLRRQLAQACARIALLEATLAAKTLPKHSGNSSCPPASDPPSHAPHRRSLRQRSTRRPGGQVGHAGTPLKMSVTPTQIEHHAPAYCSHCGRSLPPVTLTDCGRYQVVDLPPITVSVTEHRFFQSQCPCGACTGDHPPQTGVCYGPGIKAVAAYLSVRHFVPYARLAEMFQDLFHVPLSPGTVVTALRSMAAAGRGAYEAIRQ